MKILANGKLASVSLLKLLVVCVALTAIVSWPMACEIMQHAPQSGVIHVAELLSLMKAQITVFTTFLASAVVLKIADYIASGARKGNA